MPPLIAAPPAGPRSPLAFFILVFALAAPFWLLGAMVPAELMPRLPIAALMFVTPGLAGLMLAWREGGPGGARALLGRALDLPRLAGPGWLAPILLLRPALAIAAWLVLRLTGAPVPDPVVDPLLALGLTAAFFVAALGEELGWTAYATEPLATRLGPLGGALVLGAVWSVFHVVALLQAHRSAEWIAWWTLGTIATRVIMTAIYLRGGRSVCAVALFHMTVNLCWQLFPVRGSWFDPRLDGLLTAGVAVAAGVALWRTAAPAAPSIPAGNGRGFSGPGAG